MRIDFDEFQIALEDSISEMFTISHFLDTETGEIIGLCREYDDYEELSAKIDEGLGDRHRRIKPLESRESFRIMEDFTDSLPESSIKSSLFDALARSKPFRRFRDVVHSDLALRDQWFQFRDDAHERYMRDWLSDQSISAEILRRRA